MVRIGSYMTARIKCKYKDEKSEKSVVSGYYLLSPWDRIENLNAKIYVEKNNDIKNIVVIHRTKEIFKA
ncbi:flagellar basal-body rod protein FlgF [Peptoniphilus indolicus ATCC 29427]|uniref:Flagellar basal-body rod protein FlgF n=3 Tax=Peptoniphilus indolicus TaxID=33030 RepID=G4D381_9FIRM|nr:flagellar basal-body rod protein FlgF [Peptoniphilus indolicus ATCC 29427]